MRVLLTGGAGFVGSHVVEHLLENTDWQVVVIDSFRHRGDAVRLPRGTHEVFCHDLAAPLSSREIRAIGPIDYIINAASESHVDRSIDEPVPFIRNNVELMLSMLEYARQLPALRAFVQVSTDEVYGPAMDGYCSREWDPILPSNPYAASKAAQEAIAISYWRTYGIPVVLTNTMNMIGERQDTEKFLPKIIGQIARGHRVTIHGNEEVIGSRCYLHARVFSDALLFILGRTAPSRYCDNRELSKPDRYNVVGDVELTNLELANGVAQLMGVPLDYELVDFHQCRPGHDRRYALDGSKLAALGWRPPLTFEQSLQQVVRWTLAHTEWLGC